MSSCKQATSLRLASHIPGILMPPHIPYCSIAQSLILVSCRFGQQQKQQTCACITLCQSLKLTTNSHVPEPLPFTQLSPNVPTTPDSRHDVCIYPHRNGRSRHKIWLNFRTSVDRQFILFPLPLSTGSELLFAMLLERS